MKFATSPTEGQSWTCVTVFSMPVATVTPARVTPVPSSLPVTRTRSVADSRAHWHGHGIESRASEGNVHRRHWASVIRVVTTGRGGGPGPGRGCLPVAFLSESLPLFNVKAQDSVSNQPSNFNLSCTWRGPHWQIRRTPCPCAGLKWYSSARVLFSLSLSLSLSPRLTGSAPLLL